MFEEKNKIPTYQELMRPVLVSAKMGPRKISEVVDEISENLGLSETQKTAMLPSGKQTVIANRIHWARSYLKQAGLVKSVKRGWFEITDIGRQSLEDRHGEIDIKFLEQFDDFLSFRQRSHKDDTAATTIDPLVDKIETTPDEQIDEALTRWNKSLASSLLQSIQSASPAFFEHVIVELLIAMGYGGTSETAGRALGRTGDNGVDGVIDQDPLGVDQIYIQAKRYAAGNSVGSGEVRDFFGALNIHRASKGIFVTTSTFTASSVETANALGNRIVLIDGRRLTTLLIRYGVGCRQKTVVKLMELDEAFFDDA